ncbi:hypothetical protein EV702DRAFT_953762, partial [Suillus placidus]
HLACSVWASRCMAAKSGKKNAVRDAAVHTNAHLGEPEEPNRFGLTLDLSRLRVGIQDEEFIKLKVGHEVRP